MEEQRVSLEQLTLQKHERVVSKLWKSSSTFTVPGGQHTNRTTGTRGPANTAQEGVCGWSGRSHHRSRTRRDYITFTSNSNASCWFSSSVIIKENKHVTTDRV